MSIWGWIGITAAVLIIGLLLYWLLITTEGTYLGQGVVTWLYDVTAKRYDSIKGFDEEMESMFLGRPLAAALKSAPAPLVIDIGTGTGRLPLTLLDQATFQGRIIGFDHSRKMLAVAADKLNPFGDRVLLIWRDGMHLPFPDACVDAVTCLEMLEFTPDPEALLAEAVRVLRSGGLLLTTRRLGLDARLMPGKTYSIEAITEILTRLGIHDVHIGRWQMDYDLVWGLRSGTTNHGSHHPLEVLRCVQCGKPALIESNDHLTCDHCHTIYPIRDGIIEMTT